MKAALSWLKRNSLWLLLVVCAALLSAAVVLAALLRAERAKRRLQEAIAKARGAALQARHGREESDEQAEAVANEERQATNQDHAKEVSEANQIGERLDGAAGDPSAELDEVNEWIRSQK